MSPDYVVAHADKLTFDIENTATKSFLQAQVSFHEGTVRIQITDNASKHPRHKVLFLMSRADSVILIQKSGFMAHVIS